MHGTMNIKKKIKIGLQGS